MRYQQTSNPKYMKFPIHKRIVNAQQPTEFVNVKL